MVQIRFICVVIALWLGLFANISQSRLIIEGSSIGNFSLETSQYYWRDDDLNSFFDQVSGQLANATDADLNGKIVFLLKDNADRWLSLVSSIQGQGAIAILYGTSAVTPGQYGCGLTAKEPSGVITIPVAEINRNEFEPILNAILNGTVVLATLTSEGSPWVRTIVSVGTIIVFRAVLSAAAAGLIGYALYKLIMFIRHQGHQFNVPQVCLALEIIANLLRLIYLPVDPFACFGVYGQAFSFVTTISIPYEVATFVLITFYWYEALTDASVKVYPFLSRFKPFFFAFVIGFIVVINLLLVLGYFLNFSATTPLIIIYVIISVAFLVFYSVTVASVTKKVAQANSMRHGKKMKLQSVNKKIIINGVTRVVSIIPVVLFIAPTIATVPIPHVVVSAFIYGLLMLDSWARIYLFAVPKKTSSSTSKTNSTGQSVHAASSVMTPRSTEPDHLVDAETAV